MDNFFSDGMDEMKSIKIFTSESEDSLDQNEVPRISIPDEESGDGALCLVCFFFKSQNLYYIIKNNYNYSYYFFKGVYWIKFGTIYSSWVS